MPAVEIDEAELVKLQSIAKSLNAMMGNPDSRKKILEAQKITNPNAVIPELDVTKGINDELGAVRKELKDLAKSLSDDKAEREERVKRQELEARWEKGRLAAQQSGYTKDGLEALEKYMVDKGIADHEVAMPAFERLNPPARPVESSGQNFDVFQTIQNTSDEMKKLVESHGQDRGAMSNLINKALTDVRSGGR